jgi:alkanesulfonate monooxygenase SsuD/methylene tetrahydromethanopterin reductase-like flavin-dependent oxidoreductase (luciferase family)
MYTGVYVETFEELADVRLLADLAAEAEAAGWDGFFICDQLVWPWADAIVDTTVVLTAIALRTERIRFGALVVPLPRRRPAKVAREYATLDRLSGGRLIFGAGAGGFREEFGDLGDATEDVTRAEMLDEALTVVTRLWSGDTFDFDGRHYQVRQTRFRPTPVQRPRIPVWIGGQWPRRGPVARAARWDGFAPMKQDGSEITLDDLSAISARLELPSRPGFDLIAYGAADPDLLGLAEVGVTWWVHARPPWAVSVTKIRDRIAAGPPRSGQPPLRSLT